MPHQCVRCNTFYDDGAQELLKGCSCGARLFFYVRKEKLEKTKEIIPEDLTEKDKRQIEKDVYNLIGSNPDDNPVILDVESIRVLKPGKYELDLVHLFQEQPLIFKLDEGKYVIDVAESFNKLGKKRK